MKVETKNNQLIITLDLNKTPQKSQSGKTFIVATTGGFAKTTVDYNGKPISVSVNATIPASE